jgi:serine/threonine protein kinase
MSASSADRDPLDRLAEEFVARFRAVERPSLTEYAERLPGREDEVRDLFPALVEMERLKPDYTGPYQPESGESRPTAAVGDRVGPYKLLERIGEGGMGEVWVADQLEPIKRRVALKLIKPGMDTRSVLARFEAERQALAVMDHPNISKVLDAGTTADGRPFFVMELVKGTPITQFCDARKLTPKQRLELFIPVCLAIQHAHQKGIIHRDIKPSNVLVELYDDKAVAKVIDFGVAKAIGQQLTEKTIYTGFGALVGTPAYMAPEQATFNALDVDTRADVYALGVLLYELLAGSPPVELERLKKAALDEVLRIVRDEEPPRPSQRLSTSQAKASIAATRQSDPVKLSQLMKGELDWIVMKALEKDRTRRYDSATALAKDVERYLTGDAVEACPPTLGYRLRKAYRRNRPAVRVAGAFVGILLVAVGVSTWLAVKATRAEAVAEEKRRESDENARLAQSNATLYAEAFCKAENAREEAQLSAFSLQIDLDSAEIKTDPRVGILRLARTIKTLPIDEHVRHVKVADTAEITLEPIGSLLTKQRELREFGTAAIMTNGQRYAPLLSPINHDGQKILSYSLSPDGTSLLTLGADGVARLLDTRTAKQKAILQERDEHIVNCGFSPDGKIIFTDDRTSIARFWRSVDGFYTGKTKVRQDRYSFPSNWTTDRINSEMYFVKRSGQDGKPRSIHGREMVQIGNERALTVRLIVKDLVGGGFESTLEGPAELWNTTTGDCIAKLSKDGEKLGECRLGRSGRWITGFATSSSVVIFSANDGREVASLNTSEMIRDIIESPDGRKIAILHRTEGEDGNYGHIQIWDTAEWNSPPIVLPIPINIWWSYNEWKGYELIIIDNIIAIYTPYKLYLCNININNSTKTFNIQSPDPDEQPHIVRSGSTLYIGNGILYNYEKFTRLHPPIGRQFHPDVSRCSLYGRFVPAIADGAYGLIDPVVDKRFVGLNHDSYIPLPGFGLVTASRSFVINGARDTGQPYDTFTPTNDVIIRLVPTDRLGIPSLLLELWAQVAVRGELGPAGEFVKWNEETWEKKRQELAAVPPPYPDFPFPGYVATDKLHWLRAEYEAAAEKDKLPLATELLRRAEASGDKAEAVRWRAERAKYVREVAPLPRAVRP